MPPDTTRGNVRRLLVWFAAGAALTLGFQFFWVGVHNGDPTVLIRVGSGLPHKARVEAELGPVLSLDPLGHDGQINYLLARDPFCRNGTDADLRNFDDPSYRYRRILYPLLAGGLGGFGPWATLAGLIGWLACGAGLAAAAAADLVKRWNLPGFSLALMLMNPGVYLAAQTLTADALALGVSLAGVALWVRRAETAAAAVLAAAVLVKETSLLVPLCLAADALFDRRAFAAVRLMSFSAAPFLLWAVWVRRMFPTGGGMNNFDWPGAGLVGAVEYWVRAGPAEVIQGCLAVVLVTASLVLAVKTRDRTLRFSCLAWSCLAFAVSTDVWGYPGNLLRALSPLWAFAALAYGSRRPAPG